MNYNNLADLIIDKMQSKCSLSNTELVQLIELAGSYLNIRTIPGYAKENNLSYNGVKKHREIQVVFGVKFVIDNN